MLGLLVLLEASCHKRQVLVPTGPPAPAPSTPAASAPAAPKPATQEIPPPPTLSPEKPAEAGGVIPTPQVGPPPAERPRRAPRPSAPPVGPTAPAAPLAPPTPAPQLVIVLSPDEQRQYNANIDQKLQSAESSLRSIAQRRLSKEQRASMEEARNFVRQAQALRPSDLPGALRLAERAQVLARNLASSLR